MIRRFRFSAPPNWPQPPRGWSPPPDWRAPSEWGPAPPGWQFWVQTGFWQVKYAVPTIFAVVGLLILVIGLTVSHQYKMSVVSYEAGYATGLGFGKTQGLLSEYPLTEESKGLNCSTLFDIDESQGFEVDNREIPTSSIDEDDYYEGCKDGIDDGFESYN